MSQGNETEGGFFDQLDRWLDLGCEYNKTLVDDALDYMSKPGRRVEGVLDTFSSLSESVLSSGPNATEKVIQNQLSLMERQLQLTESMFKKLDGKKVKPVATASVIDRRFLDDEWEDNPVFNYIKQSYLLNSQALTNLADCLELDEANKEKVAYYLRQLSSALAPTNFPMTNPEIIRKTKETKGENLYQGIKQLLEDKSKSGDYLNICMSDDKTFELGENLAATPGKVVYENDLMQLIQYEPTTAKVREKPLLLVPSWVNKFYILDLRQKNSYVKWALDQGLTVFMISWRNPDASFREIAFDDYLQDGLLTALEKVKAICNVTQVNCAGYCLGGILLAIALAYLAKIDDKSISSATYLAASLNFENPGDVRALIDDTTIKSIDKVLDEDGYLDGRELAVTFCMLRENELYWNYFVQNYLKGERPSAFDILYWNTDSTNVPAKAHKFVLHDLHCGNGLMHKNQVTVLGESLDLSLVKTPVYVLGAEKDHIAKWQSAYSATQLQGGSRRFVLAGSGHIAGVINSPESNKYHYYTNRSLPQDPEDWLDNAFKHEGSWWTDWYQWVKRKSGNLREARQIDSQSVIEDAPGRYVKVKLEDINVKKAA